MNKILAYEKMIDDTFSTVGQAIGVHVMLIVIEHASWQARLQCKEAALIEFSEHGVSLEALKGLEPAERDAAAHAFFMSVVATLGRLVGKQLAQQLLKDLQLGNEGE